MQQADTQAAAQTLLTRRLNRRITGPLAAQYRPDSVSDALAIQRCLIELMAEQGDAVGGWKCALPIAVDGLTDAPVVAPIFSRSLHADSPCPIQLDKGLCKIEPEIAFCFGQDLPHREAPYTESEIVAALSGAHLALELILSRYLNPGSISYIEHLADCLFNQGLFIGPAIPLEQAFKASAIEFKLTTSQGTQSIAGKHPCGLPQAPLFWLVNFLSQQGVDIKAGQQVITSSYAGVLDIAPTEEVSLTYEKLGEIRLQFKSD
ncbi:hydratase [Amphritea opalescens]|uniref:Hydratase n=1 Tax=Amphritea opalescens TaxID=2490544 RepID=A0A430KV93_9GAMM|nr:hydratase [Amphritea opalescens]RTE67427.1 hydratase [Amphritea opalescens]